MRSISGYVQHNAGIKFLFLSGTVGLFYLLDVYISWLVCILRRAVAFIKFEYLYEMF